MLTVDGITGGNREPLSIPFRLTLPECSSSPSNRSGQSTASAHERFSLRHRTVRRDEWNLLSIGGYFIATLDPSMNCDDVAEMVEQWNGQFCLKRVMAASGARHAAENAQMATGLIAETPTPRRCP